MTVSGATLFEDFFQVNANYSDFIDADNDGIVTDFTANGGDGTFDLLYRGIGNGPFLRQQYRAIGSGNGFQELIDYGSVNGPGSSFNRPEYRQRWRPQCRQRAVRDGIGSFRGPATVDIATLDVPASWFVTDGPAPGVLGQRPEDRRADATPGYGNNPGRCNPVFAGVNEATQAGGQSNALKSLSPSSASPGTQTLNTNLGSPDANTLFETPDRALADRLRRQRRRGRSTPRPARRPSMATSRRASCSTSSSRAAPRAVRTSWRSPATPARAPATAR